VERDEAITRLLDEFRREVIVLGHQTADDSSRMEILARHLGLWSQLMDWTASPYIAAYFAFERIDPGVRHVAIWLLDRARIDVADFELEFIDDLNLIRFNRRALQQRGAFLRVRSVSRPLEALLAPGLIQIILPASLRRNVLEELARMTIDATDLFQDLDGAARTCNARFAP
jgi:hypothetical protein